MSSNTAFTAAPTRMPKKKRSGASAASAAARKAKAAAAGATTTAPPEEPTTAETEANAAKAVDDAATDAELEALAEAEFAAYMAQSHDKRKGEAQAELRATLRRKRNERTGKGVRMPPPGTPMEFKGKDIQRMRAMLQKQGMEEEAIEQVLNTAKSRKNWSTGSFTAAISKSLGVGGGSASGGSADGHQNAAAADEEVVEEVATGETAAGVTPAGSAVALAPPRPPRVAKMASKLVVTVPDTPKASHGTPVTAPA
jgi:hypothetical protein